MYNRNSEVGERIFEKRKQCGFTREKLAEMSEISVQFLADIEKGRKSMTVTTLRRISAALGVSPDYIVNGTKHDDIASPIYEILSSLSEFEQKQAVKMLTVFVETIKADDKKK